MAVLKRGSQGADVSELQKKLNEQGYSLKVDGIYGDNTASAVKDYQRKNGLSVDGIYGDQTKNALYGSTQTQQTQQQTESQQEAYRSYTGVSDVTNERLQRIEQGYKPSEAVQGAMAYLDSLKGQAPGAYTSPYADQLQNLYQQIVGRDPFSYDVTGDQLYQLYRDQAMRNGQIAMMDTMGQAAGLTGGYGSTYGQAVGQQAYNQYLQSLNDIVPELYGQAYDRWQNEGQQLQNQYTMLMDQENQAYGRYQDNLDRYNQKLSTALGVYESERGFDYDQYLANMDYWNQRAQMENQDYWDQFNAAMSAASGSGGDGGRSNSEPEEALKQPTQAMIDEALRLYKQGGVEGMESVLDMYEDNGYDAEWLLNYILDYQVKAGGSVASAHRGKTEQLVR